MRNNMSLEHQQSLFQRRDEEAHAEMSQQSLSRACKTKSRSVENSAGDAIPAKEDGCVVMR
jgi:hypothetical protein